MKIYGAENKRIKSDFIFCPVLCIAVGQTIKISIYELCLLCTFWLGTEQCSIGIRIYSISWIRSQICMTHVPETGARKSGVDLWPRFLERVWWV